MIGVYYSYNFLSGKIPDYYLTHPKLTWGHFEVNNLTFSGIISNLKENKKLIDIPRCPTCTDDTMVYAQQRKIYVDTTITVSRCTNYTLDLKIDDTVTTSTYTWFKNGSPFMTIKGSNKLIFQNFGTAHNGTYTVFITNPLAPQLTLESHPIRLIGTGSVPNIINPRDTSFPCGLTFRLPVITGQNLSDAGYFTGPGRFGTRFNAGQIISTASTLYVHSGAGACPDEDTFRITVTTPVIILRPDTIKVKYQTPAPFDLLANDQMPQGLPINVTMQDPSNGKSIYSTSTGKGTFTPFQGFSGTEKLNYTVCITGCPDACKTSTLTFEVAPPCGDRNSLVLPNVIFPTGSGPNRYFIVEAIQKCPDSWGPRPHKLQVFNRWGDQVFRNNNYLNDWEGTNTSGQPLPEGTYYYLLDLGSIAAPIKGYVTIMR